MLKKILITLGIIVGIILIIILVLFLEMGRISKVTKGNSISSYTNPKKALVVIDIQKNITNKNGKLVTNLKQTDQIIENTNKIIANAKRLKLEVIYITNEFKKNSLVNIITGGALGEGNPMALMDERIKIVSKNHFIKNIMDSFSNKEFESFLINNQINHLIITGLDAEACVDRTIKSALNRNYKVIVISDGVATSTDEKREKKINEFKQLGAEMGNLLIIS